MGDWVYYSCLMDLKELSSRVHYAEEIHKSEALSDMIQRRLTEGRSAQIAEYLRTQRERFFNSLVVGTYGGKPNWYALSHVRNITQSEQLQSLSDETVASIGFLTLSGDESLFAIDGEHRLAGIKKVLKDGLKHDTRDEVSVIFVAHNVQKGLERTRRLFTTLNKTARPVSKGDIIALDEDDVMAICVRRLIEDTDLFAGNRLAFVANNNMPVANMTSLTTIGNLYDLLTILFTAAKSPLRSMKSKLQRVRPDDTILDEYFEFANELFIRLREEFDEINRFFAAANTELVVKGLRGSQGGSALFRPIGLEIFLRIIARLTSDMSFTEAVKHAAKLPRDLNTAPYKGLMWDPSRRAILNSNKVTLREILLHMVGRSKFTEKELLERYRKDTGDQSLMLPELVI